MSELNKGEKKLLTFQNAVSLREIYLHVIAAICYLLTASPFTSKMAVSERGN